MSDTDNTVDHGGLLSAVRDLSSRIQILFNKVRERRSPRWLYDEMRGLSEAAGSLVRTLQASRTGADPGRTRTRDDVLRLSTPDGQNRVETGPVQFGDDWPGVFIRGDHALALAYMLEGLGEFPYGGDDALLRSAAADMAHLLRSCVVGGDDE